MNVKIKTSKHRGFTLIELLVVMSIISVLIAVAVATFPGVLKRSRESRRLGDMNAVRTALEQYYSENGYYPPYNNNSSYGWYYSDNLDWIPGSPSLSGGGRYIEKMPQDPQQTSDWCTKYRYYRSGCCTYYLEYNLESRDDQKALGRYQGSGCNRYRYRITGGG